MLVAVSGVELAFWLVTVVVAVPESLGKDDVASVCAAANANASAGNTSAMPKIDNSLFMRLIIQSRLQN